MSTTPNRESLTSGKHAWATTIALALIVAAPSFGFSADRYIVKFRHGKGDQGRAAVQARGAAVKLDLKRQEALAAVLNQADVDALRGNPNVEYVEVDQVRKPLATQSTPYGISMVQADVLTDASAANRTLCIIDSGYYIGHEDLSSGSNVTGTSDSGSGNWYQDGCGHGTHVAGTISALNNGVGVVGVNPSGKLKLHIVKVFGDDCSWTYSSSLVNALSVCRNNGANVVSMSLGGGRKSRLEENAFNDAYNSGVLSIAAAGNDGTTGYSYPASYASVVSVAAIDSSMQVADFSQKNSQVELAAPGVAVLSTVPFSSTATLTVDTVTYSGATIEFSAQTTGTAGALADGGLCDATNAAWLGKTVLCQRGTISFYDKVMNVQNSQGAAAVIYNNAPGGFAGTLGSGNSSAIPAISLSQEDGQYLLANKLGHGSTMVSKTDKPASGYEAWDGTSMATPHVSGVAALVWSYNPNWTNAQVRDALDQTALDLGAAGRDNSYGYGLVQAKAALDKLQGTGGGGGGDTTPPVISSVSSRVTNSKNGSFEITWTTDEASDSVVSFVGGGTYSNSTMTTSHKMSFRGTKGATYQYTVSSTDAAGNTATAGPFTHQN